MILAITRAMPSLNYTSTNVVPLQSIYLAIKIMGVVFILIGIFGLITLYWLHCLYVETEEERK